MGDTAGQPKQVKQLCMQLFDRTDETLLNSGPLHTNLIGANEDPLALTIEKGWLWPNGSTLKVRFLSRPSNFVIAQVKKYASVWEKYANLKFQWVESGPADIRIAFLRQPNGDYGSSYSYVGRHSTQETDQNKETMNFGWFDDSTPDTEFERTTLHEFGHAIGAHHEQVSPNWPFQWNQQAVYDYYMGPPNNWKREDVDLNFNNFEPMPKSLVESTEWDGKSIMQYYIQPNFTVEGKFIPGGDTLSQYDKTFISRIYPKLQVVQVFVENHVTGSRKNIPVPIDGNSKKISAYLGTGVLASTVGITGTAASNVSITLLGNGQTFKLNNNGVPTTVGSGQPVDISQWSIRGKTTP